MRLQEDGTTCRKDRWEMARIGDVRPDRQEKRGFEPGTLRPLAVRPTDPFERSPSASTATQKQSIRESCSDPPLRAGATFPLPELSSLVAAVHHPFCRRNRSPLNFVPENPRRIYDEKEGH